MIIFYYLELDSLALHKSFASHWQKRERIIFPKKTNMLAKNPQDKSKKNRENLVSVKQKTAKTFR